MWSARATAAILRSIGAIVCARGRSLVMLGVLCLSGYLAPGILASPVSGPHETLAIEATTTEPGASTGLFWMARYHGTSGPHSKPPALRRLVIQLPLGTRYDTSVPGRCRASDAELMVLGEAACPASSRVGVSEATLAMFGLGSATYPGVDFNGNNQLIELFESGGRPVGIARTYIHGRTLTGPVPTCLTGGNPPSGCPSDELYLLSNRIMIHPVSVGSGRSLRNFATTPAACPQSRHWVTPVTFYYSDGSADRVTTRQPCTPHPGSSRRRRLR